MEFHGKAQFVLVQVNAEQKMKKNRNKNSSRIKNANYIRPFADKKERITYMYIFL